MKIQIKITIALVSLIVISAGMFVLLSPNNTQVTEATSKQTQQVSQKSAEVTENLLQDNKVVDNYHEVFVEKKEDESLLKKVIKEKELDELALDSDKLIQERVLESIYPPFVWLDALHYKIKENGRYISKAVYTILGVGLNGKKEILGLYISENKGANFWLQVLTDLNNREYKHRLMV